MEVLASRTENKLMLTLFLEYFKDNKFTDKLKFITHYKHDISGKWKLTIFSFIYYSSIPRLPPKQLQEAAAGSSWFAAYRLYEPPTIYRVSHISHEGPNIIITQAGAGSV